MENRAFVFTTIYWHELAGKLNVRPLEDALNKHINLADYGSGVERIHFTFMAVRPSNTIHENDAKYDAETKTVEIALKLSYEHVVEAGEVRVLEMMRDLFLVSLDLYVGMGVRNFALSKLKKDLNHVL